ncbi:transposase family protein [Deinococcus sp. Arct2-2]|uniref:helix-turn-helix domain-containing protein n=1 Tax=Deinococcus sp. Arct2-2 TaxID=2568653 RepID=UPI0010A327B5|nr:transposase family protein [Deinococcus sp. Arct2-2]THF69867.1 transposase family protein [Deinococcus sp. Arct2-2]
MNRKQFRRRTGVYPETFAEMQAVLTEREGRKKKSGRPATLSAAEQLLMTLEVWRESRTFAYLGDDWGVHETTVHRTVERVEAALIASAQFQMPKKHVLQEAQLVYSIARVDAFKVPCERPKKAAPLIQRQEKAASPKVLGADLHRDAAHSGHSHQCWGGS